jgi:hypothetical protein
VAVLFYIGRGLQVIAMWLLLVDIVTAGPLGPNPRLFAVAVGVFIAGWLLVKRTGSAS